MNTTDYAILGFVVSSVILWGYAVTIYINSRKINNRFKRIEQMNDA